MAQHGSFEDGCGWQTLGHPPRPIYFSADYGSSRTRPGGAVRVEAADGYGIRDAGLIKRVPRRSFGSIGNISPGMQFEAQLAPGQRRVVTVTAVKGDMVTVDGNHPLAGQNLNFEVEITEVRDATEEELAHGHVHGPGGHHH